MTPKRPGATTKPGRRKASPPDSGSWKEPFLVALANSGNIRASALAAKVSRQMVYKAIEEDEDFKKAVEDAKEDAIELLEAACRRRALSKSDLLMMFLLKSLRPDVYRDTKDLNLKGKLEQDIVVDLVHMEDSDDD